MERRPRHPSAKLLWTSCEQRGPQTGQVCQGRQGHRERPQLKFPCSGRPSVSRRGRTGQWCPGARGGHLAATLQASAQWRGALLVSGGPTGCSGMRTVTRGGLLTCGLARTARGWVEHDQTHTPGQELPAVVTGPKGVRGLGQGLLSVLIEEPVRPACLGTRGSCSGPIHITPRLWP